MTNLETLRQYAHTDEYLVTPYHTGAGLNDLVLENDQTGAQKFCK